MSNGRMGMGGGGPPADLAPPTESMSKIEIGDGYIRIMAVLLTPADVDRICGLLEKNKDALVKK